MLRVQTRLKSKKILPYAKRQKENFVTPFTSTGSLKPTKKMKIITLISNFEMYEKEKSGKKPNTLRKDTIRLRKQLDCATHIRIRKGYTKEYFTRKITDDTRWDGYIIISWNPYDIETWIPKEEVEKLGELTKSGIAIYTAMQILPNVLELEKERKSKKQRG